MTEKSRLCFRCERPFFGKAGRIVNGKPACPSCANALRSPIVCTDCGGWARRRARSPHHGGLICQPCLQVDTHATCSRCRRYRAVAQRNDEGKAFCKSCIGENPISHSCPDCGDIVPGAGAARCMPCSLHKRIMRSATAYAERLEHLWVKELFLEFHTNLDTRRVPGNMARRVPGHFAFFQRIERHCDAPKDLTQTMFLNLFGAENLRSKETAVGFLVKRLSINWDERQSFAHSAETIAQKILESADDEPFGSELRRFHSSLMARNLTARTRKTYLTAAFGLMKHAGVKIVGELTQTNVNGWLHKRRGQAASLGRFLSWIENEGGPALAAQGRPKTAPRKRERIVLQKAEILMQQLENVQKNSEHSLILARACALFLGVHLENVLSLRTSDVKIEKNKVFLLISKNEILDLPSQFIPHFVRKIEENEIFIFPGRPNFKSQSVCNAFLYSKKL